MHVTATTVTIGTHDAKRGGFVGLVTFQHRCKTTGEQGTAHFECFADLPKTSQTPLVERILIAEACRQVRFMPEYRLGQSFLSFEPEKVAQIA